MNFLREIEENFVWRCRILEAGKKCKIRDCGNCNDFQKAILVEEVEKAWRSFWLQKKKELQKEIKRIKNPSYVHYVECLKVQLAWVEEQLKECKTCGDKIIVMNQGKRDEYWLCECGNSTPKKEATE